VTAKHAIARRNGTYDALAPIFSAAWSLEQTQATAMVEAGRVRAVGRAPKERLHAAKIDEKIVKIQDGKRAHGAKLLEKKAKLKRGAKISRSTPTTRRSTTWISPR
jgi:hypothetical protein